MDHDGFSRKFTVVNRFLYKCQSCVTQTIDELNKKISLNHPHLILVTDYRMIMWGHIECFLLNHQMNHKVF